MYLGNRLPSDERVGIFTSDGSLSNFTADPKQIHEALSKLRASSRSLTRIHECPELSDYQAVQITEFSDDITIDAWKTAIEEAITRCHMADPDLRKCLTPEACPRDNHCRRTCNSPGQRSSM